MRQNIERALAARRESRRVAFRESFSEGDWNKLVRDVVAIANSGGGVVLFGVTRSGDASGADLTPLPGVPQLIERICEVTDADFDDLEFVDAMKQGKIVRALSVGTAQTPLVIDGVVYVRHGARSGPATSADVAAAIERRVKGAQREWLSAMRRAVRAPAFEQPALPSEVRDSESPDAVPIRIVEDTRAPAYRLVDYDKTHPYRQKELLAAFRERVPDRQVNQFDLLAVRHTLHTDERPEFSHQSLFGTRQYSQKFLDWLVEQAQRDPHFFEIARAEYSRERAQRA